MKLLKKEKIANYGVSVWKISDAIEAIQFKNIRYQLVFNMFRQKPIENFLKEAKKMLLLWLRTTASGLGGFINKRQNFQKTITSIILTEQHLMLVIHFRVNFAKRFRCSGKIKRLF